MPYAHSYLVLMGIICMFIWMGIPAFKKQEPKWLDWVYWTGIGFMFLAVIVGFTEVDTKLTTVAKISVVYIFLTLCAYALISKK